MGNSLEDLANIPLIFKLGAKKFANIGTEGNSRKFALEHMAWGKAPIRGANAVEAVVTVPKNVSGRTIHIILEVVDNGKPALTAYRRVILKVRGKPVKVPVETEGVLEITQTSVLSRRRLRYSRRLS